MKTRPAVVLLVLGSLAAMVWVAVSTGTALGDVALFLPAHLHLLVLALVAVDLACRAGRFLLLVAAAGGDVGLVDALRAQLGGEAAAAVSPSRSAAEPGKLLLLGREGKEASGIGAALVGETLYEVGLLVAVTGVLACALPAARATSLGTLAYAGVVCVTTGGAVMLARLPTDREPPRWWRWVGLSRHRWRWLRCAALQFRRKVGRLGRLPTSTSCAVAAFTLVHIAARVAVLPAVAMEVAPDAAATLFGWSLLLLYGGALLPPPGGGGLVELGFAAGLDATLPERTVAGTLVWWRFYSFYLPALAGGAVWLHSALGRGERGADV